MSCTRSFHELVKASPVAFRATVVLGFLFWSVDEAGRDEECQSGTCRWCGSTIALPIARLAPGNPFERVARARKVAAILALVPVGTTREQIDASAECLMRFDADARRRFSRAAAGFAPGIGQDAPSEATWAEVVAAVRGRLPADEVLARAEGRKAARA